MLVTQTQTRGEVFTGQLHANNARDGQSLYKFGESKLSLNLFSLTLTSPNNMLISNELVSSVSTWAAFVFFPGLLGLELMCAHAGIWTPPLGALAHFPEISLHINGSPRGDRVAFQVRLGKQSKHRGGWRTTHATLYGSHNVAFFTALILLIDDP